MEDEDLGNTLEKGMNFAGKKYRRFLTSENELCHILFWNSVILNNMFNNKKQHIYFSAYNILLAFFLNAATKSFKIIIKF